MKLPYIRLITAVWLGSLLTCFGQLEAQETYDCATVVKDGNPPTLKPTESGALSARRTGG